MTDRISLADYRALTGQQPVSKPARREAATYPATATEAQVQAAICDYLTARHIPHSVTDAARVFGADGQPRKSKVSEGWPDISGVLPGGRAFFVEVKSASGKLRRAQKVKISELRAAGALVIVAHSVDEFLNEFGKER